MDDDEDFISFVERPPEVGKAQINVLLEDRRISSYGSRKLILRSFIFKNPFKSQCRGKMDKSLKYDISQTELDLEGKKVCDAFEQLKESQYKQVRWILRQNNIKNFEEN